MDRNNPVQVAALKRWEIEKDSLTPKKCPSDGKDGIPTTVSTIMRLSVLALLIVLPAAACAVVYTQGNTLADAVLDAIADGVVKSLEARDPNCPSCCIIGSNEWGCCCYS